MGYGEKSNPLIINGLAFLLFFSLSCRIFKLYLSCNNHTMKTESSNKLITVELTMQGIWSASKHMVHQSKKRYKRSRDKYKKNYAE